MHILVVVYVRGSSAVWIAWIGGPVIRDVWVMYYVCRYRYVYEYIVLYGVRIVIRSPPFIDVFSSRDIFSQYSGLVLVANVSGISCSVATYCDRLDSMRCNFFWYLPHLSLSCWARQ